MLWYRVSLNGVDTWFVVQNIESIVFTHFGHYVLLSGDAFVSSTCAYVRKIRVVVVVVVEVTVVGHANTHIRSLNLCINSHDICVCNGNANTHTLTLTGTTDMRGKCTVQGAQVERVTVLDRLPIS